MDNKELKYLTSVGYNFPLAQFSHQSIINTSSNYLVIWKYWNTTSATFSTEKIIASSLNVIHEGKDIPTKKQDIDAGAIIWIPWELYQLQTKHHHSPPSYPAWQC